MKAPLLTQVRPCYFSADCGMAYIMRLENGKFAIIDGNIGERDEPEHLYSLLCSQCEGEVTVEAWFITHPHDDHFCGFARFAQAYREKVKIEKVIYNFPKPGVFDSEGSDPSEFFSALDALNTEIVTAKTGDTYNFGGARFDVLFTCEDLYPGPVKNINNSSIVMMMELGRYKTLWLGDLQREGAERLCANTPKNKLKCDILQVGHHGYGGGSDELYRAADPEILLWPCPDFWFHSVRLWECNDYLISSKNIKATFVAGQRERVFDLTKDIKCTPDYEKKDVSSQVCGDSLTALEWSCLTGGRTGYAPAELEFSPSGLTLRAGEAYTLCQLLQRGQTAMSERFTFELCGTLGRADVFGLLFDSVEPMQAFADELCDLPRESEFNFRLEIDRAARTAKLYNFGKLIKEKQNIFPDPRDVILVLKNAEVKIKKAEYKPE